MFGLETKRLGFHSASAMKCIGGYLGLVILSLSLSTSQYCCEEDTMGGIKHAALSSMEEGQDKNVINT